MDNEKYVDESWKESVSNEKVPQPPQDSQDHPNPAPHTHEPESEDESGYGELNFLNYLSSLVFQAMIFLGEMPNPASNQVEKNLRQAKLLIDTIAILRDKTKGNLNKEEENMLNGALYELQMRYVELYKQEGIGQS